MKKFDKANANSIDTRCLSAIYVVHAMRWGDCEKHCYIVLATNHLDEAIKAANDCEIERSGKYGCEVLSFNCGEKTIIRKPYCNGIEPF